MCNKIEENRQPEKNWVEDVLDFWFCELQPKQWFVKSEETDQLIRNRFRLLHERLANTAVDLLLDDRATALAAIIVLDQFPRNMFRDTPAAFASDPKALELAKQAVRLGFDLELKGERRIFIYLPYEHSEDLADQDQALALISAIGNTEYTRYAQAHREIICQFGRFPHRNAILNRPSTPQEEAFLAPGSTAKWKRF